MLDTYTGLEYYGNADGALEVKSLSGKTLSRQTVTAGNKIAVPVTLATGENTFTVTMTPKADFRPAEFEKLSSYQAVKLLHTVTYEVNTAKVVYVSPKGTDGAAGTLDEPSSLTSAAQKAIPGQRIILTAGTYLMSSPLVLERGINGTALQPIHLEADSQAQTRPVLDFGRNCAGVILAADYWHLAGFDVTNTQDGQKGIQVSGKYTFWRTWRPTGMAHRRADRPVSVHRHPGGVALLQSDSQLHRLSERGQGL